MLVRYLVPGALGLAVCTAGAFGGGSCEWTTFVEDTGRLVVAANLGADDVEEKDYAWADLDKDGDDDLVIVRKTPFSNPGARRNVLLMNEGGMLVDRTAEYASASDVGGDQGFLTPTDDRDVVLVDVDGDTWLDMVTAVTYGDGLPKHLSHPRVYMNLGDDKNGDWLGFLHEDARIPQLPIPGFFCGIGVGDVTGNGAPDLFLTDYFNTLEDVLLVNDGNGFYSNATASAFAGNLGFLSSTFSAHAVIIDVNDDGWNDIIKVSALGPYELKIAYNNPANPGVFSLNRVDVICPNCADYHVTVDDLNNDGMLDLVESDDGSDQVFLNQGNGGDGFANFSVQALPGSGDFNGNSVIVDLNNDTFKDLIITDVDVDLSGCARNTRIYRNNGNVPNVAFTENNGGIPLNLRIGGHDVATIDLNEDGLMDFVLGRCTGTEVWINTPPVNLNFDFPEGIPNISPSAGGETFEVTITPECQAKVTDAELLVSVNGGPFSATPLASLGGVLYEATLPAASCGDHLDFYVAASAGGLAFTDPPGAPSSFYEAEVADSVTLFFEDTIEGDTSGWTIVNDPSLTAGGWEQADPNGTISAGTLAAPEDDATPAGTQAFITQNCAGSGCDSAGQSDLDGGPTDLISPVIDLSGATSARISFARWVYTNDAGTPDEDPLFVAISNDGGDSWVDIPPMTSNGTGSSWETAVFSVTRYITPTAEVRVRFRMADVPNNSITEGGIDDFTVEELVCDGGEPCPWDCADGGDGAVGTADLLAMLAQWGTPGACDLDGGNVGTSDLLDLLANWGDCP